MKMKNYKKCLTFIDIPKKNTKKKGKMGTHGMQYIPCSYQFKHAKHKKHVPIHDVHI